MKPITILGCDPGLSGGLALLSPDGLLVEAMPVLTSNGKKELDIAAVSRLLQDWSPDHAYIEQQQSMPRQGVASSFKTGMNYGLLLGLLYGMSLPITTVRPSVWKAALGVPKDKTDARHRATQLFPRHAGAWAKVSQDGLAEAAMIAYYGRGRA